MSIWKIIWKIQSSSRWISVFETKPEIWRKRSSLWLTFTHGKDGKTSLGKIAFGSTRFLKCILRVVVTVWKL